MDAISACDRLGDLIKLLAIAVDLIWADIDAAIAFITNYFNSISLIYPKWDLYQNQHLVLVLTHQVF